MADALRQQMADDIASLVRKQTFAGSGVWRQSGNATLRIETQTDSIVEALQRIPSRETQEEEERESDRQHEELIDAIEGSAAQTTGSVEKKSGGLFGGIGSLFKGLGKIGTLGLGFGALGLKGILRGFGFLLKGLNFLGGPLLLLGSVAFLGMTDEQRKEVVDKVVNFFTSIGDSLTKLKDAFVEGFEKGEELDTEGLKTSWTNFTNSVAQFLGLIEFDLLGEKYKGAEGVARAMGVLTKELSQRFIDFSEATLNFLADPGKGLGELKGSLSASVKTLGIEISRVFKEIFSYRGIIRQLESLGFGFLIPSSAYRAAAKEQKKDLTKELNEVVDKQSIYAGFVTQRQLELEELPVTDIVGRKNKQAALTRAKMMSDYFGNRRKEIMSELTNEQGEIKRPGEMSAAQEMEVENFSFGLGNILLRLNDIVLGRPFNATQQIIGDALLPDVPVGQMERPAISQTVDNILSFFGINTGENLNQLQVARTTGGTSAVVAPVVIDNSQQPTNIYQTNIAAPQTKGPALVGEGRDKVNLKR